MIGETRSYRNRSSVTSQTNHPAVTLDWKSLSFTSEDHLSAYAFTLSKHASKTTTLKSPTRLDFTYIHIFSSLLSVPRNLTFLDSARFHRLEMSHYRIWWIYVCDMFSLKKKNNKKPRITNCIRTLSFITREEKCKSWESWITDGRYPSISSGITCIRFQSRKNWRTEKLPSGNDFAKHQIITSCLSKELTYFRFSYCILRDIAVIQSQRHQLD